MSDIDKEVRLFSSETLERAKCELSRVFGVSSLLSGADEMAPYAVDDSVSFVGDESRTPDLVVIAKSEKEIMDCLRIANDFGIPVTPRAGGTGRTGGAMPHFGGIVLATHGMNQIKHISREDQIAVVGPGVILKYLHDACEAEGLFYPPDANSLDSCMLGGNVAENAGGPRAFKYGSTSKWVLGLDAILMGGTRLHLGRRTLKGVTGYDLTSLFVGSEGTLGVFTEITLRLIPKPPSRLSLLAYYENDSHAIRASLSLLDGGVFPSCIEFMDSYTVLAMRESKVGGLPPNARSLMLVDLDGEDLEPLLERAGNTLLSSLGAIDVEVAQDLNSRERIWKARRDLAHTTRKLAKYKLSEDVVVPRSKMVDLLESVTRLGEKYRVRHLTYGHAGDGNLHVSFFWDDDEDEAKRVQSAIDDLMYRTIELGGTLSGEHGVGLSKIKYLPLEQSEDVIQAQKQIKSQFDPKGLLNPGKIFPSQNQGKKGPHGHFNC